MRSNFVGDYSDGFCTLFAGCEIFFRDKSLWRYALLPMCLMTAAYALAIGLVMYLSSLLAARLEAWIAALPRWISWIAGFAAGSTVVIAFLLALVIAVFTMSAVYEIFGGPFFDRLILHYERKYRGTGLAEPDWKNTLLFLRESVCYSVSTFLGMIFWILAGLFLPAIGPVMLFLFMSFRLGAAFVMPTGFLFGMDLKKQRTLFSRHRMRLLGFGSAAYLVQLIPLAPVLLLPGLILGGAELLHGIAEER